MRNINTNPMTAHLDTRGVFSARVPVRTRSTRSGRGLWLYVPPCGAEPLEHSRSIEDLVADLVVHPPIAVWLALSCP